jgi:motility quorum-sensing regulator/GCU-specific mRNA interferase toxin
VWETSIRRACHEGVAKFNQLGYFYAVEKRKPHCPLHDVKTLVAAGRVRTTHAARSGAVALGFDYAAMLAVISALQPADFYKSMTTHADHRVWQDVYRPQTSAGGVYLKLTVIDDVLIVSFKEL